VHESDKKNKKIKIKHVDSDPETNSYHGNMEDKTPTSNLFFEKINCGSN
jgi:hypothetical protein